MHALRFAFGTLALHTLLIGQHGLLFREGLFRVYGLLVFGEESIEGECVISGVIGAAEFVGGFLFAFGLLVAVDGQGVVSVFWNGGGGDYAAMFLSDIKHSLLLIVFNYYVEKIKLIIYNIILQLEFIRFSLSILKFYKIIILNDPL